MPKRIFRKLKPISRPGAAAVLVGGWAWCAAGLLLLPAPVAAADSAGAIARTALVQGLAAEAKAGDAAFTGFSVERGAALFAAVTGTSRDGTPSCTTCHGPTPKAKGETRAGKSIDPLALSLSPDRFTDPEKVAKWFGRNCRGVLGRDCTAVEKGDLLTYFMAE